MFERHSFPVISNVCESVHKHVKSRLIVRIHLQFLEFMEGKNVSVACKRYSSKVINQDTVYFRKEAALWFGKGMSQGMLKIIKCKERNVQWLTKK